MQQSLIPLSNKSLLSFIFLSSNVLLSHTVGHPQVVQCSQLVVVPDIGLGKECQV